MKNNVSLVIFIVLILALLFYLSSGKKAPMLPDNSVHRQLLSDADCSACHGPGKGNPLTPSHPPKGQCLLCHKK